MVLSDADILEIIIKRPNKKIIEAATAYTAKLMMHIKGVDLDTYIEKINSFEKQDIINIRKKYAVSNKHLFSRINRPKDKVFSAKGGSVFYNVGDTATKFLTDYMGNIVYGYTIKQWLKVFWLPAVGYDPMGMIFIEVGPLGNAYPTYKSVKDVFEYQPNGRNLDYVIFKIDPRISEAVEDGAGTQASLYRVVDDLFDKIVSVSGNQMTTIQNETYPNYFGKVPATLISNNFDPLRGFWISDQDDVVELADQYLREGSVKNIFKNYFGFPQAWEYAADCPECQGTGVLEGEKCSYCKGTKVKSRTDPSETLRIPVPQTKEDPVLAPNVKGYITPDIEGWDKMNEEQEMLECMMYHTLWGAKQVDPDGKAETATGKYIDAQPVMERLCEYSDATEMMETFITDLVGMKMVGKTYKGASITYGKRYLIETPDELWKKYQDARDSGAPTAILDDLLNDYLQSRYSANAMELQKQLKFVAVEPSPHITITEMGLFPQFPPDIMLKKIYFQEWKWTKTDQQIIGGTIEALQADFDAFCQKLQDDRDAKALEKQQQAMAAAAAAGGNNEGDDENDPKPGSGKKSAKKEAA